VGPEASHPVTGIAAPLVLPAGSVGPEHPWRCVFGDVRAVRRSGVASPRLGRQPNRPLAVCSRKELSTSPSVARGGERTVRAAGQVASAGLSRSSCTESRRRSLLLASWTLAPCRCAVPVDRGRRRSLVPARPAARTVPVESSKATALRTGKRSAGANHRTSTGKEPSVRVAQPGSLRGGPPSQRPGGTGPVTSDPVGGNRGPSRGEGEKGGLGGRGSARADFDASLTPRRGSTVTSQLASADPAFASLRGWNPDTLDVLVHTRSYLVIVGMYSVHTK
jgi:hypothetical protein